MLAEGLDEMMDELRKIDDKVDEIEVDINDLDGAGELAELRAVHPFIVHGHLWR